jgi:hypothetical protein
LNTGYSADCAVPAMSDRLPLPSGSAQELLREPDLAGSPSFTVQGRHDRPDSRSSVLRERPFGHSFGDAGIEPYGSRPLAPHPPTSPAVSAEGVPRAEAPLENSRASTSIFVLQAIKSQRWMPWRLKPKKDVGDCDKPRGAVYQASIRGCPNGATQHPSWGVTPA